MKNKKYLIVLIIVLMFSLIIHFFIRFLFEYPFFYLSSISCVVCLIILGLLFIEIAKKYPGKKYLILFLWIIVVISQIEYIPLKKIVVRDVFGVPIQGITIIVEDRLGSIPTPERSYTFYRIPSKHIYTTDINGEIVISSRGYFGMRRKKETILYINESIFKVSHSISDIKDTKINKLYNKINASIKNENRKEIVLTPLKADYHHCNSINDNLNKLKCFAYGAFYTAIKEEDESICEKYNSFDWTTDYEDLFLFSHDQKIRPACFSLLALIKHDSTICDKITNIYYNMSDYRKMCNLTLNSPNMQNKEFINHDEFKKYLCDSKILSDVNYYDGAYGELYQEIYCP